MDGRKSPEMVLSSINISPRGTCGKALNTMEKK